jgi:uncharacterized membrane protein
MTTGPQHTKERILTFIADRLSESSTWQGLAFLATFAGATEIANMDIMGATALGATISALIKAFLPDRL